MLEKDLENNVLIVGQGHHHPLMLHNSLETGQLDWCNGKTLIAAINCHAKPRYRQLDQVCRLKPLANNRCL